MSILRDLVVIENSVVDALLSNADARAEFAGCFKEIQALPASNDCGRCGNRDKDRRLAAYQQCRSCLAGLSGEKKLKLKQYLGTRKARVIYSNGPRSVRLTF